MTVNRKVSSLTTPLNCARQVYIPASCSVAFLIWRTSSLTGPDALDLVMCLSAVIFWLFPAWSVFSQTLQSAGTLEYTTQTRSAPLMWSTFLDLYGTHATFSGSCIPMKEWKEANLVKNVFQFFFSLAWQILTFTLYFSCSLLVNRLNSLTYVSKTLLFVFGPMFTSLAFPLVC